MKGFFFLIFIPFLFSLNHRVSVYYGNWKAYERAYPLCDVPFELLDRLYYVFSNPTGGECNFADTYLDLEMLGPIDGRCSSELQPDTDPLKGNMYQLSVIKQRFPNLKVFFVIGGMVYATDMHDYVITNDTAKMQAYVQSCVQMYQNYSFAFDGIDIDYEYPCLYDDTNCGDIVPAFDERDLFVKFVQEFRKQLGPSVLLSLATSADYQKIDALDLVQLNGVVDIYNIMTYDFTSGDQGDPYTGHHTQPRVNNDDPIYDRKLMSAYLAPKYFVNNGANASKINVGVAFYGRGFLISNVSVTNGPFYPSLGAILNGTWEVGMLDFYDIQNNYMNGSVVCFDNEAKAPYIVNNEIGMFITYDNVSSIQEKVNIVEGNSYDGLFAYELTGDDNNMTLLNAMRRNATYISSGSSKYYIKIFSVIIFIIIILSE